jgi:cyclopropane fatty-acyl-phospholipid synthase-like methyltransferase
MIVHDLNSHGDVRTMERAEWLEQMRGKAEALYDHFSPFYWVKFGLGAGETHQAYLEGFLARIPPQSTLLSAACGAGRFDGMLLEAGHSVVGIDQSAGMLARARERFPEIRYQKMGLQEIDFQEAFDGAICIDAMEHVCPEDWPKILRGFREALKPGCVDEAIEVLQDMWKLVDSIPHRIYRGITGPSDTFYQELEFEDFEQREKWWANTGLKIAPLMDKWRALRDTGGSDELLRLVE